jgi:TolA-binding protein
MPHAVLDSLREAWSARSADENPTSQKLLERLLAAEVLADESQAALAHVAELPAHRLTPEVLWWQAEALRLTGKGAEAAQAYAAAAEAWQGVRGVDAADRRAAALLGEARARRALGQTGEALATLENVPATSAFRALATLETAEILLRESRADEVEELLGSLAEVPPELQPRHILLLARARHDRRDYEGALLALGASSGSDFHSGGKITEDAALLRARCLVQLDRTGEAIRSLENYLRQAAGAAPRARAFALLDELLREQAAPSLTVLRALAQDSSEPARAAEAARYLALAEARAGRLPLAKEILRDLHGVKAGEQADLGTALALAEIELQAGQAAAVFSLLAPWPEEPRAEFLRGQAFSKSGESAEAARAFSRAAQDPALAPEAWFNAAVAALLAEDPAIMEEALARLREVDESGHLLREFRLAEALELARQGSAAAGEVLRDLLPELGGRAAVPLAEWMLVANDPEGAREILREYPDSGDEESRAYLEIFLAGDRDEEMRRETEARARDFLRRFPESPRAGSVRLKLAEIRFQRGDFVGASAEFRAIAEEGTQPDLVQQAWFLAAQAAARIMTEEALASAMLAYEEAAAGGGELGQRARFEQALLASAQKEYNDALVLLARVASEANDPELRAAALLEIGDVHFAMAAEDRAHYRQAIAAWQALAADENVADHWRRQALTKAGLAHEHLSEIGPALEAFYAVLLEDPDGAPPDSWFERAGFEAGRLLEKRASWREAIRVYEMLASREGARAEEAAARANRLRLENFLWEE